MPTPVSSATSLASGVPSWSRTWREPPTGLRAAPEHEVGYRTGRSDSTGLIGPASPTWTRSWNGMEPVDGGGHLQDRWNVSDRADLVPRYRQRCLIPAPAAKRPPSLRRIRTSGEAVPQQRWRRQRPGFMPKALVPWSTPTLKSARGAVQMSNDGRFCILGLWRRDQ